MPKRSFIFVALLLLAAACATTSKPPAEWAKTRETAEDFEAAKAACTEKATSATATITQQGTATRAALGIFLKCMSDKGWTTLPASHRSPTAGSSEQ